MTQESKMDMLKGEMSALQASLQANPSNMFQLSDTRKMCGIEEMACSRLRSEMTELQTQARQYRGQKDSEIAHLTKQKEEFEHVSKKSSNQVHVFSDDPLLLFNIK